MSDNQKQNIIDMQKIMFKLTDREVDTLRQLAEKLIDVKVLALVPDAIIENMDITEKLMLIDLYSKSEEKEETVSFEEALKEEGLTLDDLQN